MHEACFRDPQNHDLSNAAFKAEIGLADTVVRDYDLV